MTNSIHSYCRANGKWIVYFASGNYWQGGITGRHHLLKRLYDSGYNILFINSLGLASVKSIKRKTLYTRIRAKLLSYTKYLKVANSFLIFSPISVPIGLTFFEKSNSFLLIAQLKLVFQFLRIKKPYIIVASPKAANLLDHISHASLIYMYSDKFSSYREISDKNYIESLDELLKSKSQFIVSNLVKTYEDLQNTSFASKSVYLPHSVDFQLFNKYLYFDFASPEEIQQLSQPIIGYYGTLTNSNDWDLIKFLARNRPDYNFLFIGRTRKDVDQEVFHLSNVYFLGHKPYIELPKYLKFFDVCIMFWNLTEWIYNSNPLKTKEFLAMGKPIVSVRIYELEKNYPGLVYLCDSKEEFLDSLDAAVSEESPELVRKRIEAVENDSWEKDAKRIIELLETKNA